MQEEMPKNDYEIDLKLVLEKFKTNKRNFLSYILIFSCLGLVFSFGLKRLYNAEASFLPEIANSKSSSSNNLLKQFGGLAGISGINIDGNISDGLRPDLYPGIIKSLPFQLHILNKRVFLKEINDSVTVENYLINHQPFSLFEFLQDYTVKLPGTIISAFSNNNENSNEVQFDGQIINMSLKKRKLTEAVSKSIDVIISLETGIVSISVIMSNPEIAAQVAQLSIDYLIQYVTDYRTEKHYNDLTFIEEQFNKAYESFLKSQNELAVFRDRNLNITTARAKTTEERLIAEFNITNTVLSSLSQQLEQAKIKVQENKPVFKILNPVSVPNRKDSPKRALILITFAFIGCIVATFKVFFLTP
jgi:hypothetical protein